MANSMLVTGVFVGLRAQPDRFHQCLLCLNIQFWLHCNKIQSIHMEISFFVRSRTGVKTYEANSYS
jgi:hypothetical protein